MSLITGIWHSFLEVIVTALEALHDVLEPMFGFDAAWGWAIIGLTLIVRTLLLPLAIKQIRSMRGMQAIQPRVKEIQEKYKVDRDLLKKDPERYQKLKAQQNEKLMALYKEEGVNPASSCLPLLLQMPIFFALFRVLGDDSVAGLADAKFYFFTSFVSADATFDGLGASVSEAGWPGWLLILLMAGSMFLTQRQMQSRNAAEGAQATQMKVMMYVFPVFLAVISFNFPMAVVLYWVTTNIWQGVQQYVMFRTVEDEDDEEAARSGSGGTGRSTSSGSNGAGATSKKPKDASGNSSGGSKGASNGSTPKRDSAPKKKKSPSSGGATHLPRRRP